jgi:hypothetical protein
MNPPRQPPETGDGAEALMETCVLIGARLAGAVRAADRLEIRRLFGAVPGGRLDILAIALAAMVNPEQSPAALVDWADRRAPWHGSDHGWHRHHIDGTAPCADCDAAHRVIRRPGACQTEWHRLVAAGVDPVTAAELTRPSVMLRRTPRDGDHL